jgi:hypothetical protein
MSTATDTGKRITLEVFRYLPEQETEPRFQTYSVPFREDWVVLDALNSARRLSRRRDNALAAGGASLWGDQVTLCEGRDVIAKIQSLLVRLLVKTLEGP